MTLVLCFGNVQRILIVSACFAAFAPPKLLGFIVYSWLKTIPYVLTSGHLDSAHVAKARRLVIRYHDGKSAGTHWNSFAPTWTLALQREPWIIN